MKLKIGDKVRYLNETGGGTVVKIINSKMVEIEDETGFEIPVLEKELVLVDSNETSLLNLQDNNNDTQNSKPNDDKPDDEIDLSFLDEPETPELKNNDIEVSLAIIKSDNNVEFNIINSSSYTLFCNVIINSEGKFKNISHFYVNPNQKNTFLEESISKLNDKYNFIFQLIFISKETIEIQSPIESVINIQAVSIIKESSYKTNNYYRRKAIIKNIFKSGFEAEIEQISKQELQKIIAKKQESERLQKQLSQKYKAQTKPKLIEIDLHIHKLLDDYKGMSNTEMLLYQLDVFHKEMKKAIENKASKIVFIHGVGNGTLKHEIRKSLASDYPKYRFQDASFKEYGFGATLVYL